MWFIFLTCLFLLLLGRNGRNGRNGRRLRLIELINTHKINQIEWQHRNKVLQIMLTLNSTAKSSRNTENGHNISKDNGIIIRYFWLEGKLCNTDSFDMKNLRFSSS